MQENVSGTWRKTDDYGMAMPAMPKLLGTICCRMLM